MNSTNFPSLRKKTIFKNEEMICYKFWSNFSIPGSWILDPDPHFFEGQIPDPEPNFFCADTKHWVYIILYIFT